MKNSQINPKERQLEYSNEMEDHVLLLHNDDINTFDFVIESLVEVCKHDSEQAEQCAYITHYKGKCDVKVGSYDYLKPMRNNLISRGLSVTIE
jgi:ATP-dependent Clp protease adaptor protein ClpS